MRKNIEETIEGHTKRLVDEIIRLVADSKTNTKAEVVDTPEGLDGYRVETAKRIHGTRSRQGMTIESLSVKANVQVRVLEQIEAGTYWPKDSRILMDIAHALGVQAFDLDPRFDPGGPLSSVQAPAPVVHTSGYISEVGPRIYPERLADDGKDSDGSG